jgi:predicted RNase H-like HicB family nuclease
LVDRLNTQGKILTVVKENLKEALEMVQEFDKSAVEKNIDDFLARKICKDLGIERP